MGHVMAEGGALRAVVRNTLTIYGRMLVSVGLGLLATRYLFERLGESDFGVLAALGASTTLLTVLSSAIVTSSQRHFAVAIGRGDATALRSYFSNAVVGFAAVGAVLVLCGVCAAPWVVRIFTLPVERVTAAISALRWSMLLVGALVASAPFYSLMIAHQRIGALAAIDLMQAALRLAAAAAIGCVPGDRLVFAAAGITSASIIAAVVAIAFCGFELGYFAPVLRCVNLREMLELVRFAGWTSLSQITWAIQLQAAALAIAMWHGPRLASTNAIAQQIAAYLSSLAYSIAYVARPAITTSDAAGKSAESNDLMFVTTKATWFLSAAFAVPVVLESRQLLAMWIGDIPPQCLLFVAFLLCGRTLYNATYNFDSGLIARGEIRAYMSAVAATYGAAIVVACCLFQLGAPAVALLIALTVAGGLHTCLLQPMSLARRLGISWRTWCRKSLVPGMAVLVASLVAGGAVRLLVADGALRIALICCATWSSAATVMWHVGTTRKERASMSAFVRTRLRRSDA